MRASVDWTFDGTSEDVIEYDLFSAYWQDTENRQFILEERTSFTPAPASDRERLNTFENRAYGFAGEARSGFELGGARMLLPALRMDFYDLNPPDDPLLTRFSPAGQSDNRLSPMLGAGLFNLADETYALWSDVRGLSVNDAAVADAFNRPGRNLSLSASYRL